MTDLNDAVTRARSDAQDLHKKIEATTAKNHAEIRVDLKNAGDRAQRLATSLKTAIEGQRNGAADHVKSAVVQLEGAAKHGQDLANATEAHVKEKNRAMLIEVRGALHNLSKAVSAQHAKMVKA